MELKPGFRRTEVGVIPADWEVRTLESFANVTSGKRLPMGHLVGDKVTPHPYIRVTDMRRGWVDTREMKYVPIEAFPPISKYRIFKEDLFISVAGTLGIVGKIPSVLDGANLTENANRISSIQCDREYLLHVMLSPVVQNVIESERTVGAQPKLALIRIRNFPVPLPPTRIEQSAIASALSDVDALLAAQDALIDKKRTIKQGAMQELLTGKRRLPGCDGEWELKRLGGFGTCYRGVSYNPNIDLFSGDTSTSVRLLRANNVQGTAVVLDGLQFVRAERVAKHQYLRNADVLICMANGSKDLVGKAARFTRIDGYKYTFGAFMGCYRLDRADIDPGFAFHLFQSHEYRSQLAVLLAGSSINNLSPKAIEGLEFRIPLQQEEQSEIARVLGDMDAAIATLEAKREKTAQLKQGMMQKLLTGKIRLV